MPKGVYKRTKRNYRLGERQDEIKNFWKKVEKTNTCWNWLASLTAGYGKFHYRVNDIVKTISAHRYSWFLAYGYFSQLYICHHCDNKKCVRPDHLFEGTAKDNSDDAYKKGKFNLIHTTRLTRSQIKTIKKLYKDKIYTGKELALLYNISEARISSYVNDKVTYIRED